MTREEAFLWEKSMWEAARNRDPKAFLSLVREDAVMVCGGYRCTGKEYAEIIAEFDCKTYQIDRFEIVNESSDSVQVHYEIGITVNDPRNSDLAGRFHVTTTWKKFGGTYHAVFNMDQRI